jgi:hypothetical protein
MKAAPSPPSTAITGDSYRSERPAPNAMIETAAWVIAVRREGRSRRRAIPPQETYAPPVNATAAVGRGSQLAIGLGLLGLVATHTAIALAVPSPRHQQTCDPVKLDGTGALQGATQSMLGGIQIHNASGNPCRLPDHPTVRLLSGEHVLATRQTVWLPNTPAPQRAIVSNADRQPPRPVVIATIQRALLAIRIADLRTAGRVHRGLSHP